MTNLKIFEELGVEILWAHSKQCQFNYDYVYMKKGIFSYGRMISQVAHIRKSFVIKYDKRFDAHFIIDLGAHPDIATNRWCWHMEKEFFTEYRSFSGRSHTDFYMIVACTELIHHQYGIKVPDTVVYFDSQAALFKFKDHA